MTDTNNRSHVNTLSNPLGSASIGKLSSDLNGARSGLSGAVSRPSQMNRPGVPVRPSVVGIVAAQPQTPAAQAGISQSTPPVPASNAMTNQPVNSVPSTSASSAPVLGKTTMITDEDLENAMNSDPHDNTDPSAQAVPQEAADAAADVKGSTLPVGMKIDERYEITGILGTGGFATVYKAHHLMIDRDVALKVMDIQKGVDKSYEDRFFREAKIAAKIHHNNVVQVYDFGFVSETHQPYIAMEMLRGHDLAHELANQGPLSPQRAFVLFRPVLDALAEGHRLGIVHKDLKPENLYLTDPGGPHEMMKVLDFGVARIDSGEVAKLTSAGQLLGTPRYLAPEYIKSQTVTPAIDVYQMALILSEALTGIPAVSGDPFHAMMLHCQGDIRITEFLLDGEIGEVYKKAICIDHEMRYKNCEEFANALDSVENYFQSDVPLKGGAPQKTPERRISSKVVGMPSHMTGSIVSPNSGELSGPQARPNSGNTKFAIIAIFLLLVVIAVALAIFMSGDKKEKTDDAQPTTQAAAAPAVPSTPKQEFLKVNFTSDPEGASVKMIGTELCKTPCNYDFLKGETNIVTIEKDGYKAAEFTINNSTYGLKNGKFDAKLEKAAQPSIVFTFNLTPSNVDATITNGIDGNNACIKGQCQFKFDPNSDKEVNILIKAPGYKDFTTSLTSKSKTTIDVTLEKQPVAPRQPKKPNTPSTTTTTTPPPAQPAAQPKKEDSKKPIMIIRPGQ